MMDPVPPNVIKIARGIGGKSRVAGGADQIGNFHARPDVAPIIRGGQPWVATVTLGQENAALWIRFYVAVQSAAKSAGDRVIAEIRGCRGLHKSPATVKAAGTPRVGNLVDAVVANFREAGIKRNQGRVADGCHAGAEGLVVVRAGNRERGSCPVLALIVAEGKVRAGTQHINGEDSANWID